MKKLVSGLLVSILAVTAAFAGFSLPSKAVKNTNAAEFNGHYYQVITTKASFSKAELECEFVGAHLATITSAEEQAFIYGLTGKDDVWVGGQFQNGAWSWVTGEPFTYTNWKPGQPSGNGNEPYLEFWGGEGQWDDCRTDSSNAYVMEWESADAFNTKAPQLISRKNYKGHSYMLIEKSTDWKTAKAECAKLGGYLVTITSKGEDNFVYNLTKGNDTWIGLNDAKKVGKYVWVTKERTDYLHFSNQHNKDYGGKEAYYGFYHNQKGWNDYLLNPNGGCFYICEWDSTNPTILSAVKTKLTVKVGKKASLKYQCYPIKKKVTFKSSKKKIATVSKSGVVKGKKKGTAIITVKAGGQSVKIKVKVK